MRPADLLERWLAIRSPTGAGWLAGECALIAAAAGGERRLALALGAAARQCGRADLAPTPAELAEAEAARPGWDPRAWSVDQAARVRLLLALPAPEPAPFAAALDRLCADATLEEQIALHLALPLLPHAPALAPRAAMGVRSAMTALFRAVALDNPFAAERFDETAWNQLVLKVLFTGSDLDRVAGRERRANPALSRALADYARERAAAGRPVDPRLFPLARLAADATLAAELDALENR